MKNKGLRRKTEMIDRLLIFIAKHPHFLPECVLRALFVFLSRIVWLLKAGGVKQFERNLSRVLKYRMKTARDADSKNNSAGQKSEKKYSDARKCSKIALQNYFEYFAETMTAGKADLSSLSKNVKPEGALMQLKNELQKGRCGLPLAMGHQGNWDYAGLWADKNLAHVITVAENLKNEQLLKTFVDIRSTLGIDILFSGSNGLVARLEEAAKNNANIIIPLLADRDLSRRGIFAKAFDSYIRVARGPATLAYDLKTPLFVVNMYRDSEKRRAYVLDISGCVDTKPFLRLDRETAIEKITQEWVDIWAQKIAEHPEDWHMMQPIFAEDLDLSRVKNLPKNVEKYIAQQS